MQRQRWGNPNMKSRLDDGTVRLLDLACLVASVPIARWARTFLPGREPILPPRGIRALPRPHAPRMVRGDLVLRGLRELPDALLLAGGRAHRPVAPGGGPRPRRRRLLPAHARGGVPRLLRRVLRRGAGAPRVQPGRAAGRRPPASPGWLEQPGLRHRRVGDARRRRDLDRRRSSRVGHAVRRAHRRGGGRRGPRVAPRLGVPDRPDPRRQRDRRGDLRGAARPARLGRGRLQGLPGSRRRRHASA